MQSLIETLELKNLSSIFGFKDNFLSISLHLLLCDTNKSTIIKARDDGPGFPTDLIDKQKLGEPYIRTYNQDNISKYGLGLGTFIGKTLLEKNLANINFNNSKENKGAEVTIKWDNKDLKKIQLSFFLFSNKPLN